jgi:hypothetical protein
MPSVMRNFTSARVAVVPVDGLPPAAVLLAWSTANPDPLATAFVASALGVVATEVVAATDGGGRDGGRYIDGT